MSYSRFHPQMERSSTKPKRPSSTTGNDSSNAEKRKHMGKDGDKRKKADEEKEKGSASGARGAKTENDSGHLRELRNKDKREGGEAMTLDDVKVEGVKAENTKAEEMDTFKTEEGEGLVKMEPNPAGFVKGGRD
jgi:ribosome assembly protein YihI (activator of Der GTPase)